MSQNTHFTFVEDLKNVYEKGTFEIKQLKWKLPNKNTTNHTHLTTNPNPNGQPTKQINKNQI